MFKVSKKKKKKNKKTKNKTKNKHWNNVSNIFKVNNKDTRTTTGSSIVISDNKFVFSNYEKYIVDLWTGKIRWATCFHSYSPNIMLRKDKFS